MDYFEENFLGKSQEQLGYFSKTRISAFFTFAKSPVKYRHSVPGVGHFILWAKEKQIYFAFLSKQAHLPS